MTIVNDFLDEIPNNERSRKTYEAYLNTFSKGIDKDLNEWIKENRTKDEYTADMIRAINKLKDKAPKTVRAIKSTANSFLEFNNIDLDKRQMKRINRKIRGRRGITNDRIPKKHEIKAMLEYTTDPKMRAIILIGCSSGMRIDEILKLKISHIKLEEKPPTIYIPYENTKNNESRMVFISNEAKDSLKAWIKMLPNYKENKSKKAFVKNKQKKIYEDTIIFPLTYDAVRRGLIRLLEKSTLADKDISGRYKIHIHSFKKYFKKQMNNQMEDQCLNYLIAHDSEMDTYVKPDEDELRKAYLENMHNITIYETQIDYAETEDRLEKLEQENQELRNLEDEMRKTIKKLVNPEGEFTKNIINRIITEISNEDTKREVKYGFTEFMKDVEKMPSKEQIKMANEFLKEGKIPDKLNKIMNKKLNK